MSYASMLLKEARGELRTVQIDVNILGNLLDGMYGLENKEVIFSDAIWQIRNQQRKEAEDVIADSEVE